MSSCKIGLISSFALTLAVALACSGGGGGGGFSDSGGIVGSGARSTGPVTAIGSRVVAGTRWDVAGATIQSDGQTGFSESDLPLGRIVSIEGSRSADGLTGTATSVSFDSVITGPIDAGSLVDLGSGRTGFTIFDISVVADASTILEPPTLVLAEGQVVEVDGLRGVNEEVLATRIELEENSPVFGSTEIEAKGVALNASSTDFDLDLDGDGSGDLLVLLDSAPCDVPTTFEPTDLDLATQPFVEVDGILTADGTICADEIEFEDDLDLADGDFDDFEVEGIVTDFVSVADFFVSGVAVDASAAEFEPVSLMASLADGDRVEVEGDFSMGVLVAEEVEFRNDETRIDAAIANLADVNPGAGTLRLLGIAIATDPDTELDGFADLSELMAGDFLRVEAFALADGSVVARQIKLEDAVDDVELRGAVEAINLASSPRRLTIHGVTFEADAPLTDFEDDFDADRFYERVREGDVVEARGCGGAGTTLDEACEVELED